MDTGLAVIAKEVVSALTELEAFGSGLGDPGVADDFRSARCWIAAAEEAAGRTDKAAAVLKAVGHL